MTTTEDDIQAICDWVQATHKPDNNMICVECGEQWWHDPNVGLIQCQTYINTRIEANFAVMRRVWRLRAKWRKQ